MADVYSYLTNASRPAPLATAEADDIVSKLAAIGIEAPKSYHESVPRARWTAPLIDTAPLQAAVVDAKTEAGYREAVAALVQADAMNRVQRDCELFTEAKRQKVAKDMAGFYNELPGILAQITSLYAEAAAEFTEAYNGFPFDISDPFRWTAEEAEAVRSGKVLADKLTQIVGVFVAVHKAVYRGDYPLMKNLGNSQNALTCALALGDYASAVPGFRNPGFAANRVAADIEDYSGGQRRGDRLAAVMPFAAVLNAGGALVLRTRDETMDYRSEIMVNDDDVRARDHSRPAVLSMAGA